MENEKKNKVKNIVIEVCYASILVLLTGWALAAGYRQAKSSDEMLERLSNIEEKLNHEEKLSHDLVTLARYSDITDLTGTTWVFNDNINNTIGLAKHLNYVSNDNPYAIISMNTDDGIDFLYYETAGGNYTNVWAGGSWVDTSYKTIYITGGTDATNSQLISWLSANAVMQEIEPDNPDNPDNEVYKPLKLAQLYDMRQWFGQVDAMSGTIILSAAQTINTPLIYEIGDLEINGVHYTHLGVGYADMRGANIVVGYDFTNNTYLISTGAEYAPSAACMIGVLQVDLLTANSYTASGVQRLNMYKAPMVGGISKYETGGIIQTTGNTATSGLLLNQFKLNAITLDWSKYVPSSTKYGFLGFGSAQFTIYELLSMDLLNDTYMDFYSVGSQATGGSVFTLLGNAFSTLVPILSIQVIPGLPIGLLVCLPIVATVIVVVFKIVRK